MKKILVPDVLPNNLKSIRTLKSYSLLDLSQKLNIEKNFLSSVESNNNNFSGKNTIRLLKYLGITFYHLYDVDKKVKCSVSNWIKHEDSKTIELPREKYSNDESNINFDNDYLKSQIYDTIKIAANNKEYLLNEFNIRSIQFTEDSAILDTYIKYQIQENKNKYFDIFFSEQEDIELADNLYNLGFDDNIVQVKLPIDNRQTQIKNHKVILNHEYKIPYSNNLYDYFVTSEFYIDSPYITIKESEGVKYVLFRAIREKINNIRLIRELKGISLNEMAELLDYSVEGYTNIELGHQKISSKIMWKLVYYFKLPLELIINIDEYYFKFCKDDISFLI